MFENVVGGNYRTHGLKYVHYTEGHYYGCRRYNSACKSKVSAVGEESRKVHFECCRKYYSKVIGKKIYFSGVEKSKRYCRYDNYYLSDKYCSVYVLIMEHCYEDKACMAQLPVKRRVMEDLHLEPKPAKFTNLTR